MPVIVLAAAGGLLGGVVLSRGTQDVAAVVKWGVIGLGLFVAAKVAKVI